jgi:translation initiation factor 1
MEILLMSLEFKGRSGKKVTVIRGFTRRAEELDALAAHLKKSCGTGGTVKGMTLEIQGDIRDRIRTLLGNQGFQIRG